MGREGEFGEGWEKIFPGMNEKVERGVDRGYELSKRPKNFTEA